MDKSACIYCNHLYLDTDLSKEHVIPQALGGNLILSSASCKKCAIQTSKIERLILRGHWLGIRKKLGLKSQHGSKQPQTISANLLRGNLKIAVEVNNKDCNFQLVFNLFRPELFSKFTNLGQKPFAKGIGLLYLGNFEGRFILNEEQIFMQATDRIEFKTEEFTTENFMSFLAKLAHSFAVKEKGKDCCKEYYLPTIILGDSTNCMVYIGSAAENFMFANVKRIGLHNLEITSFDSYLVVYIQLFSIEGWDKQPVYEVIVGLL
jgi:HNH endonuclease